jgi:hypothetical protein
MNFSNIHSTLALFKLADFLRVLVFSNIAPGLLEKLQKLILVIPNPHCCGCGVYHGLAEEAEMCLDLYDLVFGMRKLYQVNTEELPDLENYIYVPREGESVLKIGDVKQKKFQRVINKIRRFCREENVTIT